MQQPKSRSTILAHSQNFLKSSALVDRLLAGSTIQRGELVLDLGAGTGVISDRLSRRGCNVIAVEKDPFLAQHLRAKFVGAPNVHVRECDVLRMALPRRPYKVFSNIPFDVTADVVSRLTRVEHSPDDAYLVVQHEAAERFIGYPRTTLAAALLFPWFEMTQVFRFNRMDFAPVPRVEVVMLRLRKRGPPLVGQQHAQVYRDFVVQVFTARNRSIEQSLKVLVGKRVAAHLTQRLHLADATPSQVQAAQWVELFGAALRVAGDDLSWGVAHAELRLRRHHRGLHRVHRTRARRLRPPPMHAEFAGALRLRKRGPPPRWSAASTPRCMRHMSPRSCFCHSSSGRANWMYKIQLLADPLPGTSLLRRVAAAADAGSEQEPPP